MAEQVSSETCQRNKREVSGQDFSWEAVLCGVSFAGLACPHFTPNRPEHTPQSQRSHPAPPNQDPRQAPSSQRAPRPPITKKKVQADVLRNSAPTDGGAIVNFNFGRQIAAQRSTLGWGSRCLTILIPAVLEAMKNFVVQNSFCIFLDETLEEFLALQLSNSILKLLGQKMHEFTATLILPFEIAVILRSLNT